MRKLSENSNPKITYIFNSSWLKVEKQLGDLAESELSVPYPQLSSRLPVEFGTAVDSNEYIDILYETVLDHNFLCYRLQTWRWCKP
jgi:hypothetical protein